MRVRYDERARRKRRAEQRRRFATSPPLATSDGLVLRANVFRPDAGGKFPVVLALSPYGKDAHFRDAYKPQWEHLNKLYPDVARNGSTGRFLRCAPRIASSTRNARRRIGHIMRTTKSKNSIPANPTPSTSRSGRPSMVCPRGYRLTLTLQGKDFARPESQHFFKGSGPFLHNDPKDRNPVEFGGENTIVTGGDYESYLLLPVIPN